MNDDNHGMGAAAIAIPARPSVNTDIRMYFDRETIIDHAEFTRNQEHTTRVLLAAEIAQLRAAIAFARSNFEPYRRWSSDIDVMTTAELVREAQENFLFVTSVSMDSIRVQAAEVVLNICRDYAAEDVEGGEEKDAAMSNASQSALKEVVRNASLSTTEKKDAEMQRKLKSQKLMDVSRRHFRESQRNDVGAVASTWNDRMNTELDKSSGTTLSVQERRDYYQRLRERSNLDQVESQSLSAYVIDRCAYVGALDYRFEMKHHQRQAKTLYGIFLAATQLHDAEGEVEPDSLASTLRERLYFTIQDALFTVLRNDIGCSSAEDDARATAATRNEDEEKDVQKILTKAEKASDKRPKSPKKRRGSSPDRGDANQQPQCGICEGHHLTKNHRKNKKVKRDKQADKAKKANDRKKRNGAKSDRDEEKEEAETAASDST
jgi:hypothetical protein